MTDQAAEPEKTTKVCPICGAKTVEYKFTLNVTNVNALVKFYRAGGRSLRATQDFGLTPVQYANFHYLRHFGLIEQSTNEKGQRRRGYWNLTAKGVAFIEGREAVQKQARSYRGETLSAAGPEVYPWDIVEGFKMPTSTPHAV